MVYTSGRIRITQTSHFSSSMQPRTWAVLMVIAEVIQEAEDYIIKRKTKSFYNHYTDWAVLMVIAEGPRQKKEKIQNFFA